MGILIIGWTESKGKAGWIRDPTLRGVEWGKSVLLGCSESGGMTEAMGVFG